MIPKAPLFTLLAFFLACGGSGSDSAFGPSSPGAGGGGGGGSGGALGGGGNAGNGGGGGGMACKTDGDCGAGGVCNLASGTCGCGGVAVASSLVAPNLLVVQDRSCSMQQIVAGQPKWTSAVQAIDKLTADFTKKIRFGLLLFPDPTSTRNDECSKMTVEVAPADGTESAIQTLLNNALKATDPNYPNHPCVTDIDTAMIAAQNEPALADMTRTSYVVLVTDGAQANCSQNVGEAATLQAITALHARGVGTFVIGFGAGADTSSLDAFAKAGGEVNPTGPHSFYDAQDVTGLEAAFASIGTAALSCDIALASPPPNGDPNLIFVYFNHAAPPVPRDTSHMNGWDYVNGVVHFYGAACSALKGGTVTSADVVFGCPGSSVPPPPPAR